jgi:hypothetical protein
VPGGVYSVTSSDLDAGNARLINYSKFLLATAFLISAAATVSTGSAAAGSP